jgi:5-enolpyruvylshikimate-3-phosphate synthase
VQAFAVVGLLAEEEMTIQGAECLDDVYPNFFAALEAVKETRKSRARG